jgi:hypothetical protein
VASCPSVPAGPSAVPRHDPFQARGPSCPCWPQAYQGGRRPLVSPPRTSPTRQPPMGQAPEGTGEAAEKRCFIFPIRPAAQALADEYLPFCRRQRVVVDRHGFSQARVNALYQALQKHSCHQGQSNTECSGYAVALTSSISRRLLMSRRSVP